MRSDNPDAMAAWDDETIERWNASFIQGSPRVHWLWTGPTSHRKPRFYAMLRGGGLRRSIAPPAALFNLLRYEDVASLGTPYFAAMRVRAICTEVMCVNPWHFRARGRLQQKTATHEDDQGRIARCSKGHDTLNPDNLYRSGMCKQCLAAYKLPSDAWKQQAREYLESL